jgi:hypothetical protein
VSKRTSTRWYIGAWIVWALSWAFAIVTGHTTLYRYDVFAQGSSPVGGVAVLLIGLMALVMLVVWISALIRLGQQHSWRWFAAVLLLHLIGLGIIGMVLYALAGRDDVVVYRPTVT